MAYPFSGIIVRYRPPTQSTCTFKGCKCAEENAKTEPVETEPLLDKNAAAIDAKNTEHQENDTVAGFEFNDELHINLWEMKECLLDIGIMIKNRDQVGFVQVDLPWPVEIQDVSDLGAKLNGEKSVAAIFNEIVHYDGFAEGNFANISFRRDGKDTESFSLLRLNSQLFKIEKIYLSDGRFSSRLTIAIPQMASEAAKAKNVKAAYIRFRIRRVPKELYTSTFTQEDRNLLSSNTETRIVDFRINVRRGVPEELLSGNDEADFPSFRKIHCFLTTERNEECISQSKNYNGYRSLVDEDIWNEYVKLENNNGILPENSVRNYLGYQWTASCKPENKQDSIKDLIMLGRFSKTVSGPIYSFRFILLGIIFGTAGNGLWNLFDTPTGTCTEYYNSLLCKGTVHTLLAVGGLIVFGTVVAVISRDRINKLLRKKRKK